MEEELEACQEDDIYSVFSFPFNIHWQQPVLEISFLSDFLIDPKVSTAKLNLCPAYMNTHIRHGSNSSQFANARTSVEMDGTLDFDCSH